MLINKDIVCISTSDWEHPWGSKQQIMSRLSFNNRILYVEYQASLISPSLALIKRRFLRLFGKLRKISDNLFVYTPPLYLLPFGYYVRFINKINQRVLAFLILRESSKLGFKKPILWAYPPSAVDLIKYFKKRIIVYHCIADFAQEKNNRLRKNTIMKMEVQLARSATVIAAMTERLHKRLSKLNPNIIYIPSAVDFDYFHKKNTEKSEIPEDLKNVRDPVLGIVGYLDKNVLDLELLEYLTTVRPQWSLVLVGPVFRGGLLFKRLRAKSNVYFLGSKRHMDIPSYIKFFDVCLIPYKKNNFIENVSPLKLYEYLACGKPIVSSNFLNVEDYKGLINVYDKKEDLIAGIESALSEDSQDIINRRIELARENSWDNRIIVLSSLIEHISIN